MVTVLENLLSDALQQLQKRGVICPDNAPAVVVTPAAYPHSGDFSSNIALALAGTAGVCAADIARALIAELPSCPLIARIAVGGPGFINFHSSPAGQAAIIESVLRQAAQYGRSDSIQCRSILLESIIASAAQGYTLSDARSVALATTTAEMLKASGFSLCGGNSDTLALNQKTSTARYGGESGVCRSFTATLKRGTLDYIDRLIRFFPSSVYDEAMGLQTDFTVSSEKLQLVPVYPVFLSHRSEPAPRLVRQGARVNASYLIDEIGEDSARFLLLMRKPCRTLHIDLQLAVSQSNNNPVYKVQLAHALVCSVLRQQEQHHLTVDPGLGVAAVHRLQEEIEREMIALLAVYPQLLRSAALACQPWRLIEYLTDLAKHLHSYYKTHSVVGKDVELRHARISLLLAVRQVLSNALGVIGVSAPEVM